MRVKGPDSAWLAQSAKALETAAYTQRDHIHDLEKGIALVPDSAAEAPQHLTFEQRLLEAERNDPDSPIDWDALPNLRRATRSEIDDAWDHGKKLYQAARDLHFAAQSGLELRRAPGDMSMHEARREVDDRAAIIRALDLLKDRLPVLGEAAAGIPRDRIDALRAEAEDQRQAILKAQGSRLVIPARAASRRPLRLAAGRDVSPDYLPASQALTPAAVATFEDAAPALAGLLKEPALEARLTAARAKVPDGDREAFDTAVSAFALLADEALSAPDYAKGDRHGENRQSYRARRVAGWGSKGRQRDSRADLLAGVQRALRSRAPAGALAKRLLEETGRELGVPSGEVAKWDANPAAIRQALADETFVPLRALNEQAARWMSRHRVPAAQTNRVVWDMTQSVMEGRFPEWRATNAGSEAQLAGLTDEARQAWMTPLSVEKPTDIDGLTFTTEEATAKPHEIFWSTKVGGPSHGFDVMPHCALAAFINTRNQVVLAKDPRWPNHAGRAYLRLNYDPDTKKPILFLEGLKTDFPYRFGADLLERAVVEHALAKAEAMGARLALSPYLALHVDDLGLPGDWNGEQKYELAPSLLVEAASVFGRHDWKATEREVHTMRNVQFHVDMPAYGARDGAPKA